MTELHELCQQLSHRLAAFEPPHEVALERVARPAQTTPRASDPVRVRLERQLALKASAIQSLKERIAVLNQRQAEQAIAYILELERLSLQIGDLSSRLNSAIAIPKSRRAVHHRRFGTHVSHALIDATPNQPSFRALTQQLHMDAPIFAYNNYQPVFKVRADGVYELTDFLALHDRTFVKAAYAAVLRRPPDPDGEAHYLAEVRSGESKGLILHQILQSDEARKLGTVIRGLESHVRLMRLCGLPLLGRPIEAFLFLFSIRAHLRDLRVLENHVIRIAEEAQILNEANMTKLRSLLR